MTDVPDTEEEIMQYRPEYDMKLIGHNLKRLREERKLTVDDVRRYLRLGSVQAVYKYEEGKSYPPADAIFALMQLYEVGLYDIVYRCGTSSENIPIDRATERQWRRVGKILELCMEFLRTMNERCVEGCIIDR